METILRRKHREKEFLDSSLRNDFSHMIPEVLATKAKITSEITTDKKICATEEIINKMKRKPTEYMQSI